MLSLRAAVGQEAIPLAEIALQYQLHMPPSGWLLCGLLQRIVSENRPSDSVSLVIKGDEAVSVAVLTGGSDTVAAYTKTELRKQGLGRMAMMGLRHVCGTQFLGHPDGTEGSIDFFQKCGLVIADYWRGS